MRSGGSTGSGSLAGAGAGATTTGAGGCGRVPPQAATSTASRAGSHQDGNRRAERRGFMGRRSATGTAAGGGVILGRASDRFPDGG